MINHHAQTRIRTAAALWVLFLAAGCSKNEAPEAEPIAPVQTAPVERAQIQRIISVRGILYPLKQAAVPAKISAPVREFYVNRGDHVRKDQLLAVLENRDLEAAAAESQGLVDQMEANYRSATSVSLPEEIAKAQADVLAAKEALDAAQKMYESRKALLEQNAIALRQVDEANVLYVQAKSQYDVAVKHRDGLEKVGKDTETKQAQAQLDAARGHLQGAKVQLEYSRIYSPIDGMIADRPLYPGEMAASGTPLLTVIDISHIIARVSVAVDQLRFLKIGDPGTITASDSPEELHGTVTVVSPALDPNSTTAEVWVEAPNPGEHFKPGSSVQVSILAETIRDAIVVPLAAVLPSPGGTNIALVVGADSLAHEHEIETGIRESGKVQILKGLEPGEQVIVVGGLGLEDKAKVRVEKPGEKSDKKSEEKADKHD